MIATARARQVAATLQARIRAGDYPAGHWLPPERDLAAEMEVHRRVVRDAITHLCQEGWLVCRPRCRPVVSPGPHAWAPTSGRRDNGARVAAPPAAASRLAALVMWHGGFAPRETAQQRIFWGFNRALAQDDYHGVFLDLGETIASEEENAAREAARLCYALEHHFAGIVFYPYAYRSNRDLIREVARQIPLVLIDRQIPGIETDYVGVDNLAAMRDATSHLLASGHQRIALVTRAEPINTVQDRIVGYRTAMRQATPPAPELVITVDSASEWALFDHIVGLPLSERPTALISVNDAIALQVGARLAALGLHVPQDIALVGFDDLVHSLPCGVGLSNVAQPFEEIGAAAARLLLERCAAPNMPARHVELPARLVVRASSTAASPRELAAVSG